MWREGLFVPFLLALEVFLDGSPFIIRTQLEGSDRVETTSGTYETSDGLDSEGCHNGDSQ